MLNIYIYLRSLVWCLFHLPLSMALKVPVAISPNIRYVQSLRGGIIIKSDTIQRYQIQIGFGGSRSFPANRGEITISPGAHLIFNGRARLSEGIVIRLDNKAQMVIGDNFYCNKNCFMRSVTFVNFGKDVLCGWDIIVNDTDGHTVIEGGIKKNNTYGIDIEEHVWITSHCRIGKGVKVAANSVVAQGTFLVKKYENPGCLIAGVPGKIIKNNINWEA